MRRLWYALGVLTGVLLMWMFTRDARRIAEEERAYQERIKDYSDESTIELATLSALHGVDYLSDEYWEQELSQYQDDEDGEER